MKELISLSKVNLVRSTLGFERQPQQRNCVGPGKLRSLSVTGESVNVAINYMYTE